MARTVRPAAGAQAWPGTGQPVRPHRSAPLPCRLGAAPAVGVPPRAPSPRGGRPRTPPRTHHCRRRRRRRRVPPLHLAFPPENSQPGCLRPRRPSRDRRPPAARDHSFFFHPSLLASGPAPHWRPRPPGKGRFEAGFLCPALRVRGVVAAGDVRWEGSKSGLPVLPP